MDRERRNKEQKIVGLVYKYTSPSGKVYIGQTTNEAHRRRTWFCLKRRYAGSAINRARAKYGPENFVYEVLFRGEFDSFEQALFVLDEKEKQYIIKYDSLKNGYNNTTGGLFPEFGIQTQLNGRAIERRTGSPVYRKRKNAIVHTKEEIQLLRKETNRKNGRWHKINQFDSDGNLLRTFSCANEAQECGFGSAANIKRACKTLGSYMNYCWRFEEDGPIMKKKVFVKKPHEAYDYARKAVFKYNKDGVFVAEYPSVQLAAKSVGVEYNSAISACLRGRLPSAHGYVWRYKS